MIIIPCLPNSKPSRELTQEEKETLIPHESFDGANRIYYQVGDTPPSAPVYAERARWSDMYEALLSNGPLITKMIANVAMANYLSSLYAVLQRGADGYPSEARLSYVLNKPGWNWTDPEKDAMNGYFISNKFTTRIA